MLPGVRFACDAYVALVRDSPLLEAVASSLTEFFAPDIMAKRIAAWEQHYPWVDGDRARLLPRPRDARAARRRRRRSASCVPDATRASCRSAASRALIRKSEILWQLLDCVQGGDRLGAARCARDR